MKNVILFLFLTACVNKQVYEKQLDEQRAEISQLQQIRKQQEDSLEQYRKNVKRLVFRITRIKAKPKEEEKPAKKIETTTPRVVCIEDDGEDVCMTFGALE